jgi:hypothetical protein
MKETLSSVYPLPKPVSRSKSSRTMFPRASGGGAGPPNGPTAGGEGNISLDILFITDSDVYRLSNGERTREVVLD